MLPVISLALDTGLLVLIWLVQLVIYPSFSEIESSRFRKWHARYSFRVSFVVVPLMFAQLGVSLLGVIGSFGTLPLLHLIGVGVAWLVTFLWAVPLHRKLGAEGKDPAAIAELVRCNGVRTVAWTSTWVVSLLRIAW